MTNSLGTNTIEFEVFLMADGQTSAVHENISSDAGSPPGRAPDLVTSNEPTYVAIPDSSDERAFLSKTVTAEKPRKSVTVVAACILRPGGREVLLSVRHAPGVVGLDGKWELPGGKIEFGESPEQTIVREIQEELGMHVAPRRLLPYLHTNLWEYAHASQHVVLACYECETEDDLPDCGGRDARWFPINQIDFESTLPGTREFVSLVTNNGWFDEVFIEFERVDSLKSATKRFTVATQATLYSRYGLVKYWGTVGRFPRTRTTAFGSPAELDAHIFEIAKRRFALGYHITAWKGPARPYPALTKIIELAKQKGEYQNRLH